MPDHILSEEAGEKRQAPFGCSFGDRSGTPEIFTSISFDCKSAPSLSIKMHLVSDMIGCLFYDSICW